MGAKGMTTKGVFQSHVREGVVPLPRKFLIFCLMLSGTSGALCFKVNVPATKAPKPV